MLLTITTHASNPVFAENVKMFDYVPTANEMANLLFPDASQSSGLSNRLKTRSIGGSQNDKAIAESISLGLPIRFDFNSDKINKTSRPFIDELGHMLTYEGLSDKKIMIEGHTDASGPANYNKFLSIKRAKSIKQYLSKQYGIDVSRLVISGKGEYKPLSGKNPFAAINRRVEIHKFD